MNLAVVVCAVNLIVSLSIQSPVFHDVLFGFDSAELNAESRERIDMAVRALQSYPNDTVELRGHTCNMGAEDYNLALGQRRAETVKAYMVKAGIDPARITTKSHGELDPVVPNDTERNRGLNRRVEFKFVYGEPLHRSRH